MMCTETDVVIIGGGAAGMAAGYFSAKNGAKTIILEKNDKLGRKMYITGKGRCNLTNDAMIEEFLNEVPRNPKFLYSALSLLSPQDTIRLITDFGCPVKIERGRRAFPVSDKASDVTKAWKTALADAGCQVSLDSEVTAVSINESGKYIITTRNCDYITTCLIIATGGLSYPATGSTGDGYRFAEEFSIPLKPRLPSLIPLLTSDPWTGTLQGLSLKNVRLTASLKGHIFYTQLGEMLFTHDGVSGPLIIELSSHLDIPLPNLLNVSIDLKPGLTIEQLDQRLIREITSAGRKRLKTVLDTLLPQRLAEIFPKILSIDPDLPANQLTTELRQSICRLLKSFPIHICGTHPIAEAVVTRGGVDVRMINPKTMSIRKRSTLFFCGEVLDVDAHTGGYNLQIAFSTGALAGKSAALQALSSETKET